MFRILWLVLLVTCGYAVGADIPPKNTWVPTINPPLGALTVGWSTVLLANGSVLGVGNTLSPVRGSTAAVYNASTNEWRGTASIPTGIVGLGRSLTKLPNGLVLAMGVDANRKSIALTFDPVSMKWNITGPLPAESISYDHITVNLLSGNVLVLGSVGGQSAGWMYDYKLNIWSTAKAPPSPNRGIQYVKDLGNGSILSLVKDNSLTEQWIGMLYDFKNDIWMPTEKIPVAMRGTPDGIAMLKDGTVFVIGFQQYPTVETISLLYEPLKKNWTKVGTLPQPSDVKGATVLPNGEVLTVAKSLTDNKITGLLFNSRTKEWRSTGKLPEGYIGVSPMRMLANETFWAIGYRNNRDADELIYSPKLNTWTRIGRLPEGVTGMCDTSREDGAVLLFVGPNVGGRSENTNALLYFP